MKRPDLANYAKIQEKRGESRRWLRRKTCQTEQKFILAETNTSDGTPEVRTVGTNQPA